MLKTLVLTRFQALFYRKPREGKKASNPFAFIIFIIIYVAFTFGSMFFGTHSLFYDAFAEALNAKNIYIAIAIIFSLMLGFIGSITMTQGQIYHAKDNELLLSMPIKPSTILLSRILVLYIWTFAFSAINFVPAMIVYFTRTENAGALGAIMLILELFLVPLFSLAASFLFAWILQLATGRMRNKSIVTIVGSLVFYGLYMAFCLRLSSLVSLITANGDSISSTLNSKLYLIVACGDAVVNPSILNILIMLMVTIVPFAVAYLILSKTFIKILTTKQGVAKTEYKAGKLKASSARNAIAHKELTHFIQCPSFVVSEVICMCMQFFAAIYMILNSNEIIRIIGVFTEGSISPKLVSVVSIMTVGSIGAIAGLTIVSISLEGKNLWILQTLPIKAFDILMGKLYAHLYVSIPFAVIIGIILACTPGLNMLERIFAFVYAISVHVFTGYFGLAVNLKYPKLDWSSETEAIKRSGASYVVAFGGMAFITVALFLPIILSKFLNPDIILIAFTILLVVGCVLYQGYMNKTGVKRFDELKK